MPRCTLIFDLCGTYNLVHIRKSDEWKMAFKTHFSHFEYVAIPFGRTNALVIFEHLMNNVFCEYLDDFEVYYIDDILIFSKNMKEHEHHVVLSWKSSRKSYFMPNWKNVNSINLKWSYWVTSSL